MNSPDNLTALIYLKSKIHKWKNIAFLLGIFSILTAAKIIFGGGIGLSDGLVNSDYIASIKIEGIIFENDYRSKILSEVAEENSIKAVIINIDSPGGGIVGSEILFNDLRNIADHKPIVVLMGSVAASGGYMASIAADHIIAHNGTLTGSIGVLMESPEITELANKIGIKLNTYKSSPLKGSPSPFEKTSQLVDQVVKESITDSYDFFVELVRTRRGEKINKNFISKVFDGRVFTGRQALQAGLIDEIGNKENAISYLSSLGIDVKKLPIKEISLAEKEPGMISRIFGFLPFFSGAQTSSSNYKIMAIMR